MTWVHRDDASAGGRGKDEPNVRSLHPRRLRAAHVRFHRDALAPLPTRNRTSRAPFSLRCTLVRRARARVDPRAPDLGWRSTTHLASQSSLASHPSSHTKSASLVLASHPSSHTKSASLVLASHAVRSCESPSFTHQERLAPARRPPAARKSTACRACAPRPRARCRSFSR